MIAAAADPTGEHVRAAAPPEEWAELLAWWDVQRAHLRATFDTDPDTPAWLPFASYPPVIGSWARRQAHEAAIHRIDAELAAGGDTVTLDPEFAADGIDELLTMVVYRKTTDWTAFSTKGTVLVDAEDVGRLWSVRLAPGTAPQFDEQPFEADLTMEGSADAVYRALWRRPSSAAISGDTALLEPLSPP